jgi:translocation and assembly module TamA
MRSMLCAGWLVLSIGVAATPALGAVVRVEIEGVEGAQRDNILALLTIEQQRKAEGLTASRVRRYHARAPREIRLALQPFGYYNPVIDSELKQVEEGWVARYRIDPGPPVRVAGVEVLLSGKGENDRALLKKASEFPLAGREIANQAKYDAGKADLLRLALERGYLDAFYERHELRIDPGTEQAWVDLELDTGPRYRFGPVTFEEAGLREDFLQRFVRFKPGDFYSASKLYDLQRALETTEYFSRVEVIPQREKTEDDRIPVLVDLALRKRNKYTFSLGYGTDTGPRGGIEWERRLLNERGHRLGAGINVSEINQTITGRYVIPLEDPRTDQLAFSLKGNRERTRTADYDTGEAGVSRSVKRGRWDETIGLRYLKEKFEVGLTDGLTGLLLPGGSWTRVVADDRIFTQRGYLLKFDIQGADERVLSDISLLQAKVFGKWIFPLAGGRIITRGNLGTTWVSDFEQLPASLRFFTGGDYSVRGYAYDTLGPTDDSGEVIGGRNLVVGSVEYDHPVHGPWGVALFYDTGNAYNTPDASLESGAGFGIRWKSPIGNLRLDFAWALSRPGTPFRLHFTMGPDL